MNPSIPHRQAVHPPQGVLFVDDNDTARMLFRSHFGGRYDVTCVDSAQAALQQLSERRFGVLITDHYMPAMTGLELCKRVAELWPWVRRFIVTASHDSKLVTQALRDQDAHGVSFKPWSFALLEGQISAPPVHDARVLSADDVEGIVNATAACQIAIDTALNDADPGHEVHDLATGALQRIRTIVSGDDGGDEEPPPRIH